MSDGRQEMDTVLSAADIGHAARKIMINYCRGRQSLDTSIRELLLMKVSVAELSRQPVTAADELKSYITINAVPTKVLALVGAVHDSSALRWIQGKFSIPLDIGCLVHGIDVSRRAQLIAEYAYAAKHSDVGVWKTLNHQ